MQQLFNVASGGAFPRAKPDAAPRSAFFPGAAEALALPPPPEAAPPAAEAAPRPLPALPRAPEAVAAEEEGKKRAEELAARQK